MFLIITLVVLYALYNKEIGSIAVSLKNANPYYLLVAIGCMFVFWLIEARTLHLMMCEFEPDLTYVKVLKLVIATQFFNGITPFSTGGQPFQIYVLAKKEKMKITHVTSATLHNFIMYQIVLVVMGTLALFYRMLFMPAQVSNGVTGLMVFLGFALNIGVVLMLLLIAISPSLTRLILAPFMFIHCRIFGEKHNIRLEKNLNQKMSLFHENVREIITNPVLFIKTFTLNILKLLSFYSVVYFVCRTIGFNGLSLIQGIMLSAYVMLITSMVPIPGASGGAEFGFIALFGAIVGGHITVILLLWRFVTYYIGLFLGLIVYYSFYVLKQKQSVVAQ